MEKEALSAGLVARLRIVLVAMVVAAAPLLAPKQVQAVGTEAFGPLLEEVYKDAKAWFTDEARMHDMRDPILFFEKGGDKEHLGDCVGSVPLDWYRKIVLTEERYKTWGVNDEISSVVIGNGTDVVKAGTVITLWDSPEESLRSRLEDDWTVIIVRTDLPKKSYFFIPSIETTQKWSIMKNGKRVNAVEVYHMHKNGLKGKVSTIESAPPTKHGHIDPQALPPDIIFYESSDSPACTDVKGYLKSRWEKPKGYTFSKHEWLDNDEVQSVRIMAFVERDVRLKLYNDPTGESSKDWGRLDISSFPADHHTYYHLPTFERNQKHGGIDYTYHKKGIAKDLNGKISFVKMERLQ